MHLSQYKLCTRKMELALEVKFISTFTDFTHSWWWTLTNGSDVKHVFPRCHQVCGKLRELGGLRRRLRWSTTLSMKGQLIRHRGNTLFCCAVTSIFGQRLLHKMTNSRLFWKLVFTLSQETQYLASLLPDEFVKCICPPYVVHKENGACTRGIVAIVTNAD